VFANQGSSWMVGQPEVEGAFTSITCGRESPKQPVRIRPPRDETTYDDADHTGQLIAHWVPPLGTKKNSVVLSRHIHVVDSYCRPVEAGFQLDH